MQNTPDDTQEITPDELIFELYHWLPLAFPTAIEEVQLKIGPTDDQKDACLIDLSMQSTRDPIKRPDFGYQDERVLDQINYCLVALLHAIAERTGELIQNGLLTFKKEDADQSVDVELSNQKQETILTRRIDKSERYAFIHHENLYQTLSKSEQLVKTFEEKRIQHLQDAQKYTFDIDQQMIEYQLKNGATKTFKMAFLASHHEESQNFIWAWANEAIPKELCYAIKRFQSKQIAFGLSAFSHPEHFFPSLMAHKLCAFACEQIKADFYVRENYMQGDQKLSLYLALWEIN